MNLSVGLIGGSGLESFEGLEKPRKKVVGTPYGKVEVAAGDLDRIHVFFLPRRGKKHAIPPNKVNYRGNIFALKKMGVQYILSASAVGSLDRRFNPGDYLLLSDFIDFTKRKDITFFNSYIDMSEPYSRRLNNILAKAVKKISGKDAHEAVYAATEGPRFETKAEIRMIRQLGAQVVGMTNFPESALAKELDIPYASLAVVTNFACGLTPNPITQTEVESAMKGKRLEITRILSEAVKSLGISA